MTREFLPQRQYIAPDLLEIFSECSWHSAIVLFSKQLTNIHFTDTLRLGLMLGLGLLDLYTMQYVISLQKNCKLYIWGGSFQYGPFY